MFIEQAKLTEEKIRSIKTALEDLEKTKSGLLVGDIKSIINNLKNELNEAQYTISSTLKGVEIRRKSKLFDGYTRADWTGIALGNFRSDSIAEILAYVVMHFSQRDLWNEYVCGAQAILYELFSKVSKIYRKPYTGFFVYGSDTPTLIPPLYALQHLYIIMLPFSNLLLTRSWALSAHEVAHIIISENFPKIELTSREDFLREEFRCDILATILIGPAFVDSLIMDLSAPSQACEFALTTTMSGAPFSQFDKYPANEARVSICIKVLEKMKFNSEVKKFNAELGEFFNITQEGEMMYKEWEKFSEMISNDIKFGEKILKDDEALFFENKNLLKIGFNDQDYSEAKQQHYNLEKCEIIKKNPTIILNALHMLPKEKVMKNNRINSIVAKSLSTWYLGKV